MPHAVLNGNIPVENIFKKMNPIFIKEENRILKTIDLYLEREKNAILIEALAIESSSKTNFLAMISGREDSFVVRLYPKNEVKKTEGVKQILAEIAKQLVKKYPQLTIGETNLGEYLKD